jgi:hypothetical protein
MHTTTVLQKKALVIMILRTSTEKNMVWCSIVFVAALFIWHTISMQFHAAKHFGPDKW